MITIIGITVSGCIFSWIIWNLLKKVEYLEERLLNNQQYIEQISDAIKEAKKRFDEADAKGLYKANDETGWFFKNLSYIQDIINNYILDEEKNKETSNNTSSRSNPGSR